VAKSLCSKYQHFALIISDCNGDKIVKTTETEPEAIAEIKVTV